MSLLVEGFAECGIAISIGSVFVDLDFQSKSQSVWAGGGGGGGVLSQKKGWLSCIIRFVSPEPLHPQDSTAESLDLQPTFHWGPPCQRDSFWYLCLSPWLRDPAFVIVAE